VETSQQWIQRDRAAGMAVAVLTGSNLLTNSWLPPAAYVPWNVSIGASLIALARSSGCHPVEIGADPRRLRGALMVGGVGAGVVAIAYGIAVRTPAGKEFFRDDRVTSVGTTTALWQLFVRIPLGTVLMEEVAFRGVLPALLTSSRRPLWLPGTISSLLFGLWHVLPSRDLPLANAGVRRALGAKVSGHATVLAVGVTTLGGVGLNLLRQRTGHLAAPIAVHLATNVLGFLGARLTSPHRMAA
jgi:uncharacterized protein